MITDFPAAINLAPKGGPETVLNLFISRISNKYLVVGPGLCYAYPGRREGLFFPENGLRATDYAGPGHWLARPERPERPVDVFYLYPTAWRSTETEKPTWRPAEDADLRAVARKFAACSSTLLP